MATTQKRAKVGGEVGANGEFYEGGRFVNTTPQNAKRYGSTPKKARKVNVAPYVWVTLEPGDDRRPIFGIVGCGAEYVDRRDLSKGIRPYAPAFEMFGDRMYNGETLANIVTLCDRYNAGEVWI